ncbi:MAG: 4Fe-4S dicluster protein [Bacillales bacterium]|nr:4Fe-4S dicluster protein [Bacillales bacterium]
MKGSLKRVNEMAKLPIKNSNGLFEIRLESIGGLGANLAGKMLAESGVMGHGFNGANFSSYGSEKKGSPVKSFIRWSDDDVVIRDHSPIEQPNVIGVFHEALYKTLDVTSGLLPGGIILVNSTRDFEDIKKDLNITHGTLAIVDALGISVEEKTKLNTAMLGALYRVIDFLNPDSMREVIRKTFEKKYPHFVEPNLRTFDRGYNEVKMITYEDPTGDGLKEFKRVVPGLGYKTQIMGGVITAQANSLKKDLSSSRQGFLPEYKADKCIHCAACDSACPDFCFVWVEELDKKGRPQMMLKGIDYQYCKGCLKCVTACPTDALQEMREIFGYADKHTVKHNFPYVNGGAK